MNSELTPQIHPTTTASPPPTPPSPRDRSFPICYAMFQDDSCRSSNNSLHWIEHPIPTILSSSVSPTPSSGAISAKQGSEMSSTVETTGSNDSLECQSTSFFLLWMISRCVRSYCDKCLLKHYNLVWIGSFPYLLEDWWIEEAQGRMVVPWLHRYLQVCPSVLFSLLSCAACIRKRYKDPRDIPQKFQEKRNSRFFSTNKRLILEVYPCDPDAHSLVETTKHFTQSNLNSYFLLYSQNKTRL